MIPRRAWFVLLYAAAIMFGLWLGARHGYSAEAETGTGYCRDVRAAVASLGEKQAEQDARSHGATDAQIDAARKCLSDFQNRNRSTK